MLFATRSVTSAMSCTSQSSSTTTMHFVNIACPIAQIRSSPCARAPRYDLRIDTIIRLWKPPPAAGHVHYLRQRQCISGRKIRSTALPIHASSIGGLPTTVAA